LAPQPLRYSLQGVPRQQAAGEIARASPTSDLGGQPLDFRGFSRTPLTCILFQSKLYLVKWWIRVQMKHGFSFAVDFRQMLEDIGDVHESNRRRWTFERQGKSSALKSITDEKSSHCSVDRQGRKLIQGNSFCSAFASSLLQFSDVDLSLMFSNAMPDSDHTVFHRNSLSKGLMGNAVRYFKGWTR